MGQASIVQIGDTSEVLEPEQRDFIAFTRATRGEGGWRDVEALLIHPALLRAALKEGFAIIKIAHGGTDAGGVHDHAGTVAMRDENREKWTADWAKERGLHATAGTI
jgi:hypothetical protein